MTTDQNDGGIGPCLNPFTLPYVDLDDKTDLPSSPGLYFVIDGEALLYIGRSKDLNQRWKGHHRYKQIKATAKNPQIAFLDCDDETLLWVERDVINRFNPALNDTRVQQAEVFTPKPNRTPKSDRPQEVKQTNPAGVAEVEGYLWTDSENSEPIYVPSAKEVRNFMIRAPLDEVLISVQVSREIYSMRYKAEFTRLAQEASNLIKGKQPHYEAFCDALKIGCDSWNKPKADKRETNHGTFHETNHN
jgi:hypothetical protein